MHSKPTSIPISISILIPVVILALRLPGPGARAAEPAGPTAPAENRPKSGYELFLEKGRILDFPERPWDQAFAYNSQCYAVKTNTSADVAEYAGVLMDAVNYHYRLRFGITGAPRGSICVFRAKEEMFDYARKQCRWSPPAASIGFFTTAGGGTICVTWRELSGERPETVLMHEGTHQFVHAVFKDTLPIWLNEGFAVYFENSRFDGRDLDVGRVPVSRLRQLQAQMRQNRHVTLEKLFATEQKNFNVDCYGSAWAFVYWLAHGGDARALQAHQAALGQFVGDCRQGRKDGKVLAGYLGKAGFADLEQEWKAWVLDLDAADPYGGVRPPDPRNFDPRANGVMQRVAAYYSGLKNFKVEFAGLGTGGGISGSFAMRRPGCVAALFKSGKTEYRLASDGKKIAAAQMGNARYQFMDAPANPGSALRVPLKAAEAMRVPELELLVALAAVQPYNSMLSGATRLDYMGVEELGGAKCHRLKLSFRERASFLWVADGAKPLVMRICPAPEGPGPAALNGPKPEGGSTYGNWDVDAELPDEIFSFK